MNNKINGRTPEEIKKGLELCIGNSDLSEDYCEKCPYIPDASCRDTLEIDALALIQRLEHSWDELFETAKQLERERNAAVRTARWQFERRSDGSVTELPVCSGCGATPKYYAPMNDVGMQVPPYCHECGSRMAPVVKLEVEK